MDITPEDLKAIAEAQGTACIVIECGAVVNLVGNKFNQYNPAKDGNQLNELAKWLLKQGWTLRWYEEVFSFVNYSLPEGRFLAKDEDYTTALLMAAKKEVEL